MSEPLNGNVLRHLKDLRRLAATAQNSSVGRNWPDIEAMRRDGTGFGLNDAKRGAAIRRYLYEFQPEFMLPVLDAVLAATLDRDRAAVPGLPLVDASCDCDSCVTRTTEMYDVPGRCLNCGQRFTVRNRKGDKPPLSVECPNCEVTDYSWRVGAE